MAGIRIMIFVLIIMHILPVAVTQLLILEYPFDGQKNGMIIKWAGTAANVLLNGLVLYEIIIYSQLDLIEMFTLACSYQDISRLAASNVISLVFSVLIGVGAQIGLCRYYRDKPFFCVPSRCVLLLLFAAIPVILGYDCSRSGASQLAIGEICRKTTVVDTAGYSWNEDAADDGVCYVVIINNGVLTCELDGIYLSDNIDELREQQFLQKIEINPGETYQFYMLSGNSLDIKRSGGSVVYLSDKFGNLVDYVEVPALEQDESYKNMGAGWQIVSLSGKETVSGPVISFSRGSGFYDGAFELELAAGPDTTIYYTLDSSTPTTESAKYSRPIYVYDRSDEENRYRSIRNVQENYLNLPSNGDVPVDKCFVVRAVAVDGDGNYSDIITKSYFVNQDKYKDRTVISLVSDPDGLFGDDGIYVTGKAYDKKYLAAYEKMDEDGKIVLSGIPEANFWKKGIEWERESNLEVFENADLVLTQPVGIRIQGNATRSYANKRFSIYARDEYSSSDYFDVHLIGDYSLHSIYTREGDMHAVSQMIGQDRDVASIDFVLADVFLDGEFWYTTYIYEKFDEKNLSQKYNLFKDNVVIAKYPSGADDADGWEAGRNPLSQLTAFIEENDLSDDENYLRYNEILDIQSYIDWTCINTFLQNMDYTERHNNLFWHTAVCENGQEGDTRWRLGLYDMDLFWYDLIIAGFDGPYYKANPFTTSWTGADPHSQWPIYSALKNNEHFCKQFVLTFMDLINTNLSVENTTAIMESLGIVNASFQEFFENRAYYVVPYMAEEFDLTGTQETVTLSSNVSWAPITLNTITPALQPSTDAFLWTGGYFTDYPVAVTANGPGFSHWEVTAKGTVQTYTDTTIEVPVSEGGVQIHAVFQ